MFAMIGGCRWIEIACWVGGPPRSPVTLKRLHGASPCAESVQVLGQRRKPLALMRASAHERSHFTRLVDFPQRGGTADRRVHGCGFVRQHRAHASGQSYFASLPRGESSTTTPFAGASDFGVAFCVCRTPKRHHYVAQHPDSLIIWCRTSRGTNTAHRKPRDIAPMTNATATCKSCMSSTGHFPNVPSSQKATGDADCRRRKPL